MRVLLVHANPYQAVAPVPAYGLERLRTAAAQTGAHIELVDPYLESEDPCQYAADTAARLQPDVVGLGIRVTEDLVPIHSTQPRDRDFDLAWFLPDIRSLRQALGQAAPQAVFVAGGAGFSVSPQECLDYLDLDWGVVGAGEDAFAQLIERVRECRDFDGVPGLVQRGHPAPLDEYALAGTMPTLRDLRYAPSLSFPVRTRIGCAMECSYCAIANLRRRRTNLDLEPVLDEIEATVQGVLARGISPVPLYMADDEFNLPDEEHAIGVLEGLIDRGLHKRISWRGYLNPIPISDRLCELIVATNGAAGITVDSAAPAVIRRNQKPFSPRHLEPLIDRIVRHGVSAELVFIFGMPGETDETIGETVRFILDLPPQIDVEWASGARVFPHTPLAQAAREEPQWVVGTPDPMFFAPVIFSSPMPPRELARHLENVFDGRPNVSRYGTPYEGTSATVDAYRVVLGTADEDTWAAVLAKADEGWGPYEPGDELQNVLYVALWHRRFDLARRAADMLARRSGLRRRMKLAVSRRLFSAMAAVRPEDAANGDDLPGWWPRDGVPAAAAPVPGPGP